MSNKIWYLPGPFHQYQEDVKALAKANGLRIIDASATDSREGAADNVPEVTIRSELKPVRIATSGQAVGGGTQEATNRDLEAVRSMIDHFGTVELREPEFGETAGVLFGLLSNLKSFTERKQAERDSAFAKADLLAKENAELNEQIKSLKSVSITDDEVEALKAKLSEAGISFRANASKEALQKLAAEIPAE